MSAQDKLDRRAAKHGLGSDERKRKIQKAKDFFSKPVPTYSKDELRKMGHPVESTAEYGKSMDRIKDKEKNAAIKPKDRETLGKLADLMKKQKRTEAYRKPTQAEIDADKRKDGKSKDSLTRYKDMKKKMYGNAMGGLKNESLSENIVQHPDHHKDYSSSDNRIGYHSGKLGKQSANLSQKQISQHSKAASDHDAAAKRHSDMAKRSRSSSAKYAHNSAADAHTTAAIAHSDVISHAKRGSLVRGHVNSSYRMTANANDHTSEAPKSRKKMSESTTEQKMYSVKYTHPTDKKSGKTTGPLSKAAADKKAAMGNRVDRVGGKYTVIPHVEEGVNHDRYMRSHGKKASGSGQWHFTTKRIGSPSEKETFSHNGKLGDAHNAAVKHFKTKDVYVMEAAGQEYTAVPIKTGDVSQADRLTIAKMDAIMKKRSKDKRQKEDWSVDEATMADRTVLRAIRIAKDMAGNHTGASKRIEKMKKGLSDHPKVKDALRLANESVSSADRKPQNYRDPETGKMKVRMVPVDRDVVRGDDKARVVRKKRFKHLRSR